MTRNIWKRELVYCSTEEAYVTATAVSATSYDFSNKDSLSIGETYSQWAQRRIITVHPK